MKKFLFLLSVCLLGSSYEHIYAQSPVNVNPLTGTANVNIPVLQISRGNLSIPINLSYNATGIKPTDVEGSAGIGWSLSAGGQISRQVRGLPDDCSKDMSGNALLGWLNNANGTAVNNFAIANDNNTATCTDETSDINYINSNFTGFSDTEPDIFNVSAPGLSCQLVLDQSHNFRVLSSYQDIRITYAMTTLSDGNSAIKSFTIINNQGTQYVFDVAEEVTKKARPTVGTPVTYFGNTYNQYKNGVRFYDMWYLSSMTDVNGNTISLSYNDDQYRSSSEPVDLFIAGSATRSTQYTLQQVTMQKILSSISNGKDQLVFFWNTNGLSSTGSSVSSISTITGMGRSLIFNYTPVGFPKSTGKYYRNFLRNFNDTGCSSPVNYTFDYYGEAYTSSDGYITSLSDSTARFNDYWGYQNANNSSVLIPNVYVNPANPAYPRYTNYNSPDPVGADYAYNLGPVGGTNARSVDAGAITAGTLKSITNVNGGKTTLVYEPNDYLDIPSNTVFKGNGIRVTTVTDNDGSGTSANDIIRSYSYLDPGTGRSSGKPLTLPVYAFTIPYTGTATGKSYWDSATVLSANDLSSDDHTIMYRYCRENKAGAGSSLYQYYVPATTWDSNATPGCVNCNTTEWTRTQTNVARPACTTYGPIQNDSYTYPFAPAANYDMERGLIQKVVNYNDAGTEVSETGYTYQRTGSPLIIQALKFEDNNGVKAYAKYNLYAATSELTTQTIKKVFDSPTLTQAQSSTTNYTYDNTYHQLIKQQTNNSDNSILTVNTTHTKDYMIASPGSDSTANAIYHLQQQNINIPVETYTQVTRAGITATISAQLIKFQTVPFSGNQYRYLPFQSLKIVSPDGTNFTPFTLTSGIAANDTQYIPATNYTAYDRQSRLQTSDDNYRHVQTTINDQYSGQTVASFKNAAVAETGFEDFDSKLPDGTNFILSAPAGIANANSHSGNAYAFNPGQTISKPMSKKPGENYYILSAWISSTAAGNINLTLTNSNNTSSSYAEPFDNTEGASKYVEWKIPVGSITTAFTMSMSTTQPVYIDDILYYPQGGEVSTAGYDPITHFKIVETNTNGVSAYYKNDAWGRLLTAYDQDKNIREVKTYTTYGSQVPQVPVPFIFVASEPAISVPVTFKANNSACIPGVTYTWNFGDGTIVTVVDGSQQQHTYTSGGQYTVTVTASHLQYGTQSASLVVTVPFPSLNVSMCQSGVTVWDNCNSPHRAIQQNDCGSNPNDALHSYYTIGTVVGGSGGETFHYQWQVSYDNTQSWTNIGTDSTQLVMSYRNGTIQQSYVARCIVTSSSGQTAITNNNVFLVQTCP